MLARGRILNQRANLKAKGVFGMLQLTGKGTAHTCDGISRRDFLQAGTLGAIGLSLTDLLAANAG